MLQSLSIATDNPDVANLYNECLETLCENNTLWTQAQTALLAAIGIYGVIRQQEALEDQIALQERVVNQADAYLGLATRNYEEVVLPTFERVTLPAFERIAKPAFDCQKDLFERYKRELKPYELLFAEDAYKLPCEYDPEYDAAQGRAMAVVTAQFDRARRAADRARGKYATGRCCAETVMFNIEAAKARARAANEGYRFERTLKVELDKWYFQRRASAAELAAAARAHVISGVNGGVAGVNAAISVINSGLNAVTSSLSGVGSALSGVQGSASALGAAYSQQASFFGNLSNGAFQLAGYQLGFGGGNQNGALSLLSNPSTVSNLGFNQPFNNGGQFAPYEPISGGVTGYAPAPTQSFTGQGQTGFGVI